VSLPHFFAGAPQPGDPVALSPEDARHAIKSLRLEVGDTFTSADGEGGVAVCRIVRADRLLVEAEVLERRHEERPKPHVTVMLAPPKGDRLTWAIQKLTEIGTDEIVLLEASRSVRRFKGDRAAKISVRLDAIAREAAKQARLGFLPRISGPLPWVEAVVPGADPMFVLWEEGSEGLMSLLPDERPERLSLVIGPEGGIPEDDARAAEAAGAKLAWLGPVLLKVETAALAAASIALARYGRLG
jgi:16S rRNA (uracil1498-N3)-methyltransferase